MKKLFCVLFAVLYFGITGFAWEEQSEKLSESNTAIIEAKRQKIEEEIALLKDHPWAGRYYFGNSRGVNATLTLAPESGFTVITRNGGFGDPNLDLDPKHGTVYWDEDRRKLSFTFDLESDFIDHFASERTPVRWGERVYLVPVNGIVNFCNAINSGGEPRKEADGRFYLRIGDEKKETKGKPELPEEFMPYLLDEPIDATIVSVKDIREERDLKDTNGAVYHKKNVTVVINKGKKDGLLPDMELYHTAPAVFELWRMKLTKIEDTQSEVEFVLIGEPRLKSLPYAFGTRKVPMPDEGWQLSTHPSWRR